MTIRSLRPNPVSRSDGLELRERRANVSPEITFLTLERFAVQL